MAVESLITDEVKKITEAEIYKENPFIDDMIGELKIKHKTQVLKSKNKDTDVLLINSDGENVGHSAFMRRIEVDEDKFAKIFISQLGALWDLKKTSLKVLSYILSTLKPNNDKPYFDMKECLLYCDFSGTQSVYNGLLGLINAKIIARTDKSYFFFINPAIVFNGSRVSFMTTYIKKTKANSKAITDTNQMSIMDVPGATE
jgi:hypothetical protein